MNKFILDVVVSTFPDKILLSNDFFRTLSNFIYK
ncbi:uncharacterized protein METZ01_LOCUS444778 [marine metagenome]|uniref:Uncharacterized protein n=1 Tax=marine metagenome TaxID=408172 RepID=A0A382Z8T3_9ZZZZ